ncbi:MAG: glycosyltransferase [Pseudomonadota bacterium]
MQTCGVEEFSRLLAVKFGTRAKQNVLDFQFSELRTALRNSDVVLFNFPIVAWKKKLLEPFLAALTARVLRKEVIVIPHEWDALNWKRRAVLTPVLMLATRICFSAPEIADEFAVSPLSRITTDHRDVVPIPPNILPTERTRPCAFSEKLKQVRQQGKFVLGQFGSIYPQKQVTAALSVAAELHKRGVDVFVAFAGSFIRGQDNVEQDFFNTVKALGLEDRVAVSGFVESPEELFAIFQEVDVFCYLLPDGLSSRRASVLAAAASGKPVVVNAPRRDNSFEHHRLFQQLIDTGGIRLVPTDADVITLADEVSAASQSERIQFPFNPEAQELWNDALRAIDNG